MKRNGPIRLGLIVPSSNTTMEVEFNKLARSDFTIHSARMRMKEVTTDELERMDQDSLRAAEELSDAKVAALAYGCTIAIMSRGIGYDEVARSRIESRVNIPTIISAAAVISALRSMKISRVALATPYLDSLAEKEIAFMESCGLEIVDNRNLGIADNIEVGDLGEEVTYELVLGLDLKRADGVLISCAQLPSLGVIDKLERVLSKPVVSTNTATFWAILKRLGLKLILNGYGVLLSRQRNDEISSGHRYKVL